MTGGRLGPLLRLLALGVLALGMVAMHHVARAGHDGATTGAAQVAQAEHHQYSERSEYVGVSSGSPAESSEHDGSSGGHGLLHLCLAVLTAVAVTAAGWLLLGLATTATFWCRLLAADWPAPRRPPPRPHGSVLLVSLGVSRT